MDAPLPEYLDNNSHPKDGSLLPTHHFCKITFNDKCKTHYSKIKSIEGLHVCPYGFVSLINTHENNCFTSLNVQGISKKKILRKKLRKNESNITMTSNKIQELIKAYEKQKAEHIFAKNITRDFDRKTNVVENKKEVLDDTLHELRNINKQLKKQAFFLNKELEKEKYNIELIRENAKNIRAATELVTVRLNAYDFTLNPELVEFGDKIKTNLYRKFEKAKKCLSVYADDQNVNVTFLGNSHELVLAYEIIDILPYILIENGIKYSPINGTVQCTFNSCNQKLESIIVKNIGPKLDKDELSGIIEKGKRGKSVEGKIKGTGKGLYLVKLICDYNDIEFSVDSKIIDNKTGEFIATLKFK
jgi:signal transduction histidine kinase